MLEKTRHTESPAPTIQRMPVGTTPAANRPEFAERLQNEEPSAEATVISADVVFTGQLTAGRKIRIDGTVEGMIGRDTKNVVVGKQGRVRAEIHAGIVTIEGRVDGDIYGEKLVELKNGAIVQGNVYCPCIQIERGASFNGTVTMV